MKVKNILKRILEEDAVGGVGAAGMSGPVAGIGANIGMTTGNVGTPYAPPSSLPNPPAGPLYGWLPAARLSFGAKRKLHNNKHKN